MKIALIVKNTPIWLIYERVLKRKCASWVSQERKPIKDDRW